MTENTANQTPFSFRLEKSAKGIEGSASAFLEFLPTCSNCGMALNKKEYRIKKPPKIPRECPNFRCPKCNIETKYDLKMMYDALTEFHKKYPTKVLLERGIKRLDFITTAWQKEDETAT